MSNNQSNNQDKFKLASVFLIGLIAGFLLNNLDFNFAFTTASATEKVAGNPNAKVVVTEYSDFECPYCRKYFQESYPQIKEKYIDTGKIRYEFKHFPLSSHPKAPIAGQAGECALEQKKFWEMHDLLFKNQTNWSPAANHLELFTQYAENIGLNLEQFSDCLNSGKYAEIINNDYQEGISQSISGTPTVFINNQRVVGSQPFSTFEQAIENALRNS